MAEIRSAFEIAMERAEKIGSFSKEELEEREWLEKGRRKAADFLSGEIGDLKSALSDVPGRMVQTVVNSVVDTLLRNVVLPRESEQWDGIRRALQGIVDVRGSSAARIVPGIEEMLRQYETTRNQYLEQFNAQVQQAMQAAGGQAGGMGMMSSGVSDMSSVAAMQKEWDRISSEINQQFEQQLESAKEYLRQA